MIQFFGTPSTNKMIFKSFLLFTALIWCVQCENNIPVTLHDLKNIIVADYQGDFDARTLELFENVETITFQGCNFTSFNENFLHPMKNLQKLVLTNTHVENVKPDASSCCAKLKTIELLDSNFNSINEVDFKKVAQMPSMERFFVHRIDIPTIPANIMVGANLKILEIQYSNLATIEDGAFNGMEKLEVLNLQKNKIKVFPTDSLSSLKNLKELNMAGNLIEKMETKDIPSLPNLEKLNLGHNPIKNINLGGLKEKLPKLKAVDVSGIEIDLSKHEGVPLVKKAVA
ncbi:leucine-rich repeat-containing protein 15-like isoform X2 [Harmonia axyridis]|uniref:leucine-rich repeat-containing protein 15-like isoform X2 n=1 Tax=Harmonia axyridis TaxID=115357 RepID=UPI001E278B59|nr:leucine-rich repeat-containing protein 15-like isoform X2 [Harmonia axyridis]